MIGSQSYQSYSAAALVVLASVAFILRRRQISMQDQNVSTLPGLLDGPLPEYVQDLISALPNEVVLRTDVAAFQQGIDQSWAQQNREIIPTCIVRPRDPEQVGQAVAILAKEHSRRTEACLATSGFFAVRSGAANPGIGAATVQDGVVIDLSFFCEVVPSADGSTVEIGAGAKWIDVYKTLDKEGLIAIGGRNSPVGVGGLALQGGISFYSPQFGFVCSNVLKYEVVLADGSVIKASATTHRELWQVLKGGGNNFGIVTRFTLRSIPSAPLWSFQMIAPTAFQHGKALNAYHNYLRYASSGEPGAFDQDAAPPILSFVYVQRLGLKLLSLNLTYTKAPEDNKWPDHFKKADFGSIWSFYRSGQIESHTDAVERFGKTSPAGTRHVQGTTTIRNHADTMMVAYDIFCQTTAKLRRVKGLLFPFTFQSVLPGWANKGLPNVLDLEGCEEPLVIISCSVTWTRPEDDGFVRSTIRGLLEQIDGAAVTRQSDHPYRFMNYCMEWQRPYAGCSEATLRRLRDASVTYDSNRLFQSGCAGGFKLDFEL